MDLSNLFILIFLVVFSLLLYRNILPALKKYDANFLIDNEFNKPQSFHKAPTSTAGGLVLFFSFLIIFFYLSLIKNTILFDYFSICTLFFLIGFIDDLKKNIKPIIRLSLMVLFLIILIQYNDFYIQRTGIEILNNWLADYKLFSLIFICLCFLFIINGANLIDGYNGLLSIHSFIILINLLIINIFFNADNSLINLLFFQSLVLLIFIFFNFPKAKVFLGDSGAYFLGAFTAISVIKTSLENPEISPFYFCILLFYLFFEVFFSFFRKLLKEKTSPIHPDKKHLHMILYKMLLKKNNDILKSNYLTSIIINLIYLLLILPAVFMMKNGSFCKYYSLMFFIIYIFSYKLILKKQSYKIDDL